MLCLICAAYIYDISAQHDTVRSRVITSNTDAMKIASLPYMEAADSDPDANVTTAANPISTASPTTAVSSSTDTLVIPPSSSNYVTTQNDSKATISSSDLNSVDDGQVDSQSDYEMDMFHRQLRSLTPDVSDRSHHSQTHNGTELQSQSVDGLDHRINSEAQSHRDLALDSDHHVDFMSPSDRALNLQQFREDIDVITAMDQGLNLRQAGRVNRAEAVSKSEYRQNHQFNSRERDLYNKGYKREREFDKVAETLPGLLPQSIRIFRVKDEEEWERYSGKTTTFYRLIQMKLDGRMMWVQLVAIGQLIYKSVINNDFGIRFRSDFELMRLRNLCISLPLQVICCWVGNVKAIFVSNALDARLNLQPGAEFSSAFGCDTVRHKQLVSFVAMSRKLNNLQKTALWQTMTEDEVLHCHVDIKTVIHTMLEVKNQIPNGINTQKLLNFIGAPRFDKWDGMLPVIPDADDAAFIGPKKMRRSWRIREWTASQFPLPDQPLLNKKTLKTFSEDVGLSSHDLKKAIGVLGDAPFDHIEEDQDSAHDPDAYFLDKPDVLSDDEEDQKYNDGDETMNDCDQEINHGDQQINDTSTSKKINNENQKYFDWLCRKWIKIQETDVSKDLKQFVAKIMSTHIRPLCHRLYPIPEMGYDHMHQFFAKIQQIPTEEIQQITTEEIQETTAINGCSFFRAIRLIDAFKKTRDAANVGINMAICGTVAVMRLKHKRVYNGPFLKKTSDLVQGTLHAIYSHQGGNAVFNKTWKIRKNAGKSDASTYKEFLRQMREYEEWVAVVEQIPILLFMEYQPIERYMERFLDGLLDRNDESKQIREILQKFQELQYQLFI